MLSHWPIRYKLFFGTVVLCLIIGFLAFSGVRGVYAYRALVRGISQRALELEPASELLAKVSKLKTSVPHSNSSFATGMRVEFDMSLEEVRLALWNYQRALESGDSTSSYISDKQREWRTVRDVQHSLDTIRRIYDESNWMLQSVDTGALHDELENLSKLTNELPRYLQNRMLLFREHVRTQYRTWIVITWITSFLSLIALVVLVRLFYVWVFKPMQILIDGSRRVAAGDFHHRIQLKTNDEVAELAAAMNAMTQRFQQIRDDLDQQVKQRTQEVVRSEQLASVGFLAAGVAHEINNPLASIAWSAESLETRLQEILLSEDEIPEEQSEELAVMGKYLRRIQDEAFRCKGITEKLLDFSRIGDIQRQDTDLRELIQVVIDMVKHLGKHSHKSIQFHCDQHVVVPVNAQEIKQVVLNLVTNALDSLDDYGAVDIALVRDGEHAMLTVSDNGIGMTAEVLAHIFEPFYTRRRGGQGTGLGLSITYRIVTDHGGTIQATSDGTGTGSTFHVTLPLSQHEEEKQRERSAA